MLDKQSEATKLTSLARTIYETELAETFEKRFWLGLELCEVEAKVFGGRADDKVMARVSQKLQALLPDVSALGQTRDWTGAMYVPKNIQAAWAFDCRTQLAMCQGISACIDLRDYALLDKFIKRYNEILDRYDMNCDPSSTIMIVGHMAEPGLPPALKLLLAEVINKRH